ncbi:MAG: RHS repeat-associated core domain-containing protein, partial [Planctomycetaceae bacterium]|nr:RHS repeat-associated core domain-containing protein [Planctomycetaceae bacterium]
YNENWQEVESVTGSDVTSYVWGLRYIDDLVLREKGSERLYSLADPNWNVIALIDASGAVVERMKYDAFGKITWLDAAFGAKTASGYGWNRTFTGQVLDSETGLMLYRNRYYHAGMGRFVSRDPIGYLAGDANVYRYVGNAPTTNTDLFGEDVWVESTPQVLGFHWRVCVTTYDECCQANGQYCITFGQNDDGSSCSKSDISAPSGSSGNSSGSSRSSGGYSGRTSRSSLSSSRDTTLPRKSYPAILPGGISTNPYGNGRVGTDNKDPAKEEIKRTSSDCKADIETKKYFESLVGARGGYSFFGKTCRDFSDGCYKNVCSQKGTSL